MNDRHIRTLATGSILAAVVFLLTALVRVPIPAGYLHLGDAGVFFAAMLLPAGWAALAAGIGSGLADLIGFPVYTPVTFLIKALAAFVFALLWRQKGARRYLAFLTVLIIPAGYFLFELLLFRAYAWADLPLNLLQSAIGAVLAFLSERLTEGRFSL